MLKRAGGQAARKRCRSPRGVDAIMGVPTLTILAELGDARRFSSSRDAVRYAGLDITVHQSDRRRSPGHLSRQGPPALRWALFEAALCASRAGSPDHQYYRKTAERLGGTSAGLAVGAQAAQAQLPHPARARRGGAGARVMNRLRALPSFSRCAAAGSLPAPVVTFAWTALIDRAAATLAPARSPDQPYVAGPAAMRDRGPR